MVRHAELFGSGCVYETAVELRFSTVELAQLAGELHRLDTEARKTRPKYGKPVRHGLTYEQRIKAVETLIGEGLPSSRVAKQLNMDVRTVERLLAAGRRKRTKAPDMDSGSGEDEMPVSDEP
jgi:hypothetical protein